MRKPCLFFCVAALVFTACSRNFPVPAEKAVFQAMDTLVSVSAEGPNAAGVLSEIENRIKELESRYLSLYGENSEVALINSGGEVSLSPELENWLEDSLEIQKKSGGAFDLRLGRLKMLWQDAEKAQILPSEAQIREALPSGTLTGLDGCLLDLGAVGKGIACDEAARILQNSSCSRAVISVGGSVLLYGSGDFRVGIRHPEKASQEILAVLSLSKAFVSTSGGYERGYQIGGEWYPHIFDPKTGLPPESGLVSVTVLAPSGLAADALSTACFVLGIEDSLPLLEAYGAQAVFVNDKKEIFVTAGLEPCFTLEDKSYSVNILP
jgi:thiamine biosynthesis lipoprotein